MSVTDGAKYCSFHVWYPVFKEYTFKSQIIEIPEEVLVYLNEDGVVLPSEAVPCKTSSDIKWCTEEGIQDVQCTVPVTEAVSKEPSFPEFSKKLQSALDSMNGSVFIKGNWSAPVDASWIIPNNSLKCSSIEDIYLLLKCSSKLLDNYNSSLNKEKCCLVLKKWEDIHPSSEFRCFVRNKSLIGITQRDCTDYHSYVHTSRMEIVHDVTEFFKHYVKEICPLQSYSFDIVRLASKKVILVDFGVFNDKSAQSYLFTWKELSEIAISESDMDQPEFRYISSSSGVQPRNDFTGFCLPYELANIDINPNRNVTDSLIEAATDRINDEER